MLSSLSRLAPLKDTNKVVLVILPWRLMAMTCSRNTNTSWSHLEDVHYQHKKCVFEQVPPCACMFDCLCVYACLSVCLLTLFNFACCFPQGKGLAKPALPEVDSDDKFSSEVGQLSDKVGCPHFQTTSFLPVVIIYMIFVVQFSRRTKFSTACHKALEHVVSGKVGKLVIAFHYLFLVCSFSSAYSLSF